MPAHALKSHFPFTSCQGRVVSHNNYCRPLLALIFLMSIGCRSDQNSESETNDGKSVRSSAGSFVVDRLDRHVRIESPAKRIVSLAPATTELLYALGLADQIVGATKYCNYPPEALKLPRVGGGTIESISVEKILSLKPDLVLCNSDTHQPLVDRLERLKVKACAVGAQSLGGLYEESEWIGLLTDREREAQDLISKMSARETALKEIVAQFQPNPKLRVFYEVWDEPLMTAAPNSFIGELLSIAGLENVLSSTSVRYPRISSEAVVKGDPELILAPTSHLEEVDVDAFQARPGWGAVSAVVDKRIHLISGDKISRCGPRVLDALAEIIEAAYPQARELINKSMQPSLLESELAP
ncbi:MAG TPA: cobalamin-binding protein [Planctomycetaceae bacterium]|nr:cobalamin-binding protein [Planctomycetaceae bacterium]